MRAVIGFGTNYGTTKDVAIEIERVLREDGWDVDVHDLGDTRPRDLEVYDLVVLGSGIKMGKWSKDVLRFMDANRDVLHRKRVALFVCCGDLIDPQKEPEARSRYIDEMAKRYPGIIPVAAGVFGGVFDFERYGILVRGVLKNLRKELEDKGVDTSKPYDFRDWEEIRRFARGLSGKH